MTENQGPALGLTRVRRRLLWAVVGLVVVVVLLATGHLGSDQVIIFCVIVPSIILHEIAHGWVALAFGDDTAKQAGRLTLNPVPHIDPIGTVILPVMLAVSGFGLFGWAKPVPVNVDRLRHRRNSVLLVSLAGPATNVLLAGLSYVVFRATGQTLFLAPGKTSVPIVGEVLFFVGLVNIWLAIFNLLPIPPLDGSVLLERVMPVSWWPRYLRFRRFALFLPLIIVLFSTSNRGGPLTWLYRHIFDWWATTLA